MASSCSFIGWSVTRISQTCIAHIHDGIRKKPIDFSNLMTFPLSAPSYLRLFNPTQIRLYTFMLPVKRNKPSDGAFTL